MIAINTEQIREFGGRLIGTVLTDRNGNKEVRDFYGRILGTYDKKTNTTRDFYGRIIANGDVLVGLLYRNDGKV